MPGSGWYNGFSWGLDIGPDGSIFMESDKGTIRMTSRRQAPGRPMRLNPPFHLLRIARTPKGADGRSPWSASRALAFHDRQRRGSETAKRQVGLRRPRLGDPPEGPFHPGGPAGFSAPVTIT